MLEGELKILNTGGESPEEGEDKLKSYVAVTSSVRVSTE